MSHTRLAMSRDRALAKSVKILQHRSRLHYNIHVPYIVLHTTNECCACNHSPFDEVEFRRDVSRLEVFEQFWQVERKQLLVSIEVGAHLSKQPTLYVISMRYLMRLSAVRLTRHSSRRKKAIWQGRLRRLAKQMKASSTSMLSRSTAAMNDMPCTCKHTGRRNYLCWYSNWL